MLKKNGESDIKSSDEQEIGTTDSEKNSRKLIHLESISTSNNDWNLDIKNIQQTNQQ